MKNDTQKIMQFADSPNRQTAQLLSYWATQHTKFCEYDCNGATRDKYSYESFDDYDADRRDNQIPSIKEGIEVAERTIKHEAKKLSLFVYFDRDPRGCTVTLSKRLLSRKEFEQQKYSSRILLSLPSN